MPTKSRSRRASPRLLSTATDITANVLGCPVPGDLAKNQRRDAFTVRCLELGLAI
jgi:hypothetical protein